MNLSINTYGYTKERRHFGRQCLFVDCNQLIFSVPQRADLRYNYILRNPVNRSTQRSVQKGLSTVLTENVALVQRGMHHFEGGWPKDVNIMDEEQTLRYRKKIEREDNWGIDVLNLCKIASNICLQNSAVPIYEQYFSGMKRKHLRDTFTSRAVSVYKDPLGPPNRPVVQIDWCPSNLNHILSIYSDIDYYPKGNGPNDFFIWNIENPLKPVFRFSGPTWTTKAFYCPKDETLIAGGFKDGKVAVWDSRAGGAPVSICPLEASHREAVSALCWVHSKTNTEFYTGSFDGSILYWDGRNLNAPFMSFLLDPEPTDDQLRTRANGCTVLEFEYTIPVRYIVGDDSGRVFLANRKGMTPLETFVRSHKLFAGPIRTIERNPFFVKNFLIVGDWLARIWTEETKEFPSTFFVRKDVQMLCGTWSTSRCSVFVTGDMNGVLDFWDLLLNQKKPIYSMGLKSPITAVKFRRDGKLLAAALLNGEIHMLEMDRALSHSGPKEKALLGSLFDRETFRSKLLQDRVDEIKLRQTLAAAARKVTDIDEMGMEEMAEGMSTEEEPGIEGEEGVDSDPEYSEIRAWFLDLITKLTEKLKDRVFVNELSPFEGYAGYDYKSLTESAVSDRTRTD